MSDSSTYVPPEIRELWQLGREGKLWAVEVVYSLAGATEIVRKRNQTGKEVMQFRQDIFRVGFLHTVGPGHWKVIPPMDIVSVDLYKQDKYLPDLPAGDRPGVA